MSSRRNVVRVCYTVDDIFKVPPHIDLDDYNQVDWWGVKWNVLRIMLKDGTTLDIESEWDNPSNFDWKRPDEESTTVEEDDGQYGLDWSEEEKEEEPVAVVVPLIDEYMKSIQAVIDEKLKEQLSIEVRWLLEKIKELSLKQYSHMKLIRDWLFTIEAGYYDEEFDVPAEMREKIYGVGLLLHMEGGFQLQQRCFYLAVNFMDDEKKRMKAIEYCWSGAGEWKY